MSVFLVFTSEVDQVHGAEGDYGVPASHAPIVVPLG
jgi:F0F1-type ATP synthase epsilon subunit